jgi:hypothetical protein
MCVKRFDGAKSNLERECGYKRAMDILLYGYVNEAKCACASSTLAVYSLPLLHNFIFTTMMNREQQKRGAGTHN